VCMCVFMCGCVCLCVHARVDGWLAGWLANAHSQFIAFDLRVEGISGVDVLYSQRRTQQTVAEG
ncbi:unnamed protein product, partial [Gadus morhua 'NCC']